MAATEFPEIPFAALQALRAGTVLPACPLALNASRAWDEGRQRALFQYYLAAGAGGLAVGVHTTQFAIRSSKVGLYRPVLDCAREEMDTADAGRKTPLFRVGGLCGPTAQAVEEAATLRELGYHAGLLNLGALARATNVERLAHCRAVSEVIPLFGFYLHAGVGGCDLPHAFWQGLAANPRLVAIKIAAFNRYQTLDVIRALAETGRDDVALYTGNDDNIVMDLLTPFRFKRGTTTVERRFVGGLLGHWAVHTRRAVELHQECRRIAEAGLPVSHDMLATANAVTDMNAVLFDAANGFRGCIPGLHEVLRRQGLLEGRWCLDPREDLSPGQAAEIDRIHRAYPHLTDDAFIAAHRDEWLAV